MNSTSIPHSQLLVDQPTSGAQQGLILIGPAHLWCPAGPITQWTSPTLVPSRVYYSVDQPTSGAQQGPITQQALDVVEVGQLETSSRDAHPPPDMPLHATGGG